MNKDFNYPNLPRPVLVEISWVQVRNFFLRYFLHTKLLRKFGVLGTSTPDFLELGVPLLDNGDIGR